jgi:hypothetical protein
MKLYEEFESKLETLCQQYDAKINLWYSPSKIPQPKFKCGRVTIDADTLYDDEEFSRRFSPKLDWSKKQPSMMNHKNVLNIKNKKMPFIPVGD